MARVILASKGEYEIIHVEDEVIFLNRGTDPSSVTTALTLGLAVLTGVGAALWFYFGFTGRYSASASYMAALILGAFSAMFFNAGREGIARIQRARHLAPEQHPDIVLADLAKDRLRHRDGRKICPLSEITTLVDSDADTSAPSWVRLHWRSGTMRVYHADSTDEARAVRQKLADLGIGN